MIALFWYMPIPRRGSSRDGQPAFFLDGETPEEMAWDLVEMFFDGFATQDVLRGLATQGLGSGAGFLMDASEYDPNLLRTQRYHEQRFTDDWWRKKEWLLLDMLGGKGMANASFSKFQRLFLKDTLLMIHLSVMIGRYYSSHHGYPEDPMTAEVALNYFEEHGYLKRIPEAGPDRQRILAGDLRPLW